MALAGELAKYIGNEIVKVGGKDLATKTATSALSSLAPKIATKAGASMANKIGNELIAGSVLDKLVPTNRMLDKAGRPVTLYHSTPNNFDKFDDAMLGSNTGYDNTALGHFVTPDKDFSKRFIDIDNVGKTGRTMELQGNIQKPITHPYMAGYKYDNKDLDKIVEDYLLATDNPEFLEELRGYALDDNSNLYDEYMGLTMADSPFEVAGSDRQSLMNKGYDAVEIVEGPKSGLVEGSKDNTPVSSYAVFNGENLRPVRHIPVEESSSLSSIIPVKRKLYRGQQYSNTDFSYNSELMNENPDKWGSKDVGKGYHFTPKKDMAGSWEGSDGGVIEVDYTPDQVLKADDARKMIEEANKLLADDKYMAKLWQENEAMAEQIEKIADGNLEALAKRERKPFVQHLKANDDELGTMYYYKDIDPELTDRFVSEFKQKAEKYMPKRASASDDDMVTLFHNTKAENIPSIMEQGLIPGKRLGGYLVSPEEAGIWTDDRGLTSGSYGGTTVKIRVPKKEFDATRVNDTQNLLNRVIKPSEIEGVDYMLFDTPLIKNSNLQEYIDRYGEDKVRELIERKGLVSPEVIDKAFNDLKNDMSLTNSNNQQVDELVMPDAKLSPQQQEFFKDSVVRDENGELMPMFHGTRGDFTVFGEKNPSSSSNSKSGVGYWFTPSEEGAKNFASSIWYGDGEPKAMKTYLNMKNPKVYESVDNSKAVESLRKELDKIELKSKTMSKPKLYYKNMYDYSVAYNMVNQGDKDMAIKWLADKSSYDEKTATELIEEIDNMKMLEDEKKRIQDEISELKYGDAYERFRTDIYKVDGQTAEDANVGGIGMALRDDSSVKKYVDNLKTEGYDGIIIKGTHYDSDTMGGMNDQYVVFDPEQIKNVDNKKPTKNKDIRYAIAAALGIGSIIGPYMNSQKSVDNIK